MSRSIIFVFKIFMLAMLSIGGLNSVAQTQSRELIDANKIMDSKARKLFLSLRLELKTPDFSERWRSLENFKQNWHLRIEEVVNEARQRGETEIEIAAQDRTLDQLVEIQTYTIGIEAKKRSLCQNSLIQIETSGPPIETAVGRDRSFAENMAIEILSGLCRK